MNERIMTERDAAMLEAAGAVLRAYRSVNTRRILLERAKTGGHCPQYIVDHMEAYERHLLKGRAELKAALEKLSCVEAGR